MKTQINALISGRKDVRWNGSHPKYAGAAMATSHIGYAGTNSAIRRDIAAKVITENPEYMRIDILGREYILKASYSCSGKSVYYSAAYRMRTSRTSPDMRSRSHTSIHSRSSYPATCMCR